MSVDASFWEWNFGDSNSVRKNNLSTIQNPEHTYSKPGNYIVNQKVYNSDGCYDTISKVVVVKEVYNFFAPNSFTPNDDGINDYFMPVGSAVTNGSFELYIFDRWGEEIYSTTDVNKPWNGRYHNDREQVQDGVYVWMLVLKNKGGSKNDNFGQLTVIH